MSFTYNNKNESPIFEWKFQKTYSTSKKHIRRNLWKKGSLMTVKTCYLAKSVSTGQSKSFLLYKKVLEKS